MDYDRVEPASAAASAGPLGRGKPASGGRSVLAAAAAHWLRRHGDPPLALVLWNGQELSAHTRSAWRLHLRDRSALLQLLLDPDYQFGELYRAGRIELEGDLVGFLEAMYRARRPRAGALSAWLHPPRRNTYRTARGNIHHHYDIGNDFYRLWLDERLVYTCAYFPEPQLSLEQAQLAKMDHVARKLRLRPGQRVVEAGCGWGALALHLAQRYGVSVRAYNIAREQVRFARERARASGLADRVEFVEGDFRDIRGTYDAFVSVGMLEHVGRNNYGQLGAVIDRCLAPEGLGLIHSIGRNRAAPMNPWIERRIFPGAYPPSLSEMMPIFEDHGFSVLDVENLRLHYARTLEHWLARFEAQAETVRAMFDEAFVRTWRLYLAGSVAAFRAGELQLFQVLFARGANNALPATRGHLYR